MAPSAATPITTGAVARQAGVEPEAKVVESFGRRLSQVLVEEARRWPADLIVLGTHGRSGLSHVLLGYVAESVVRMAPVPVLLVRWSRVSAGTTDASWR